MKDIVCKAVIAGAGNGFRMEAKEKKQYIKIDGVPLIVHTVRNISKSDYVKEIIISAPKNDIDAVETMMKEYGCHKVKNVISGGETRAESVRNGIMKTDNCDIILIHDGVRPFIGAKYINNCIEDALKYGASVLGIMPKDTILFKDSEGRIAEKIDRSMLISVQTPQCFKTDIIKNAYENYVSTLTDDASQVINRGGKVHITEGDYMNIKITTPDDLIIANEYIKKIEQV